MAGYGGGAPAAMEASGGSAALQEEGEMEELVELQLLEEARLEKLFEEQRREKTLNDDTTLETFFKLFDMWIQLYRLNKCYETLQDVVPICREKGGQLHIKGVQALAFTVWKQSKFKEAAALFHEIEKLVGASAALMENIGHTYSSMGDYPKASEYFRKAIACCDVDEKAGTKTSDKGGILLGLGLVEDRQGNLEKALEYVREAQRVFRIRAQGKPASLIAKAGMSVAKILLKMAAKEGVPIEKRVEMENEAIEREIENVQLFEVTCGEDSPLTASALKGLGDAYMRRSRFQEAKEAYARAYALEVQKDAFDLLAVMEVHNSLTSAHMQEVQTGKTLDRDGFKNYMPSVDKALERVGAMKQDGNAGAYYKVAAEIRAFASDYRGSSNLLDKAIRLFAAENTDQVRELIKACVDLKEFCDKQSKVSKGGVALATE